MEFIEPRLEIFLEKLETLTENHSPKWGTMSAQRMVEHLTDSVSLAFGKHNFELAIPEDKVEKAQAFLSSEHPLPKNFKVEFAKENTPLRNGSIQEAIEELSNAWKGFEDLYVKNENLKALHPSFGSLDYKQWLRINQKHFTHHFEQFDL